MTFALLINLLKNSIVFVCPFVGQRTGAAAYAFAPVRRFRWQRFNGNLYLLA